MNTPIVVLDFGSQYTQLIALQSHQRTHDDRHSAQREPGKLVDRGLARSRSEDSQRVLTLEHRPNCLCLAWAQRVVTEPIASEVSDL